MQLTELIIRVVNPHYVRQDYCSPVSNIEPREVTNGTKDTLVSLSIWKKHKNWHQSERLWHDSVWPRSVDLTHERGITHLSKGFLYCDNHSDWTRLHSYIIKAILHYIVLMLTYIWRWGMTRRRKFLLRMIPFV